jgi:hypothetical protein
MGVAAKFWDSYTKKAKRSLSSQSLMANRVCLRTQKEILKSLKDSSLPTNSEKGIKVG